MSNPFAESFAPLSRSTPRAAREIEVLRVVAELDGSDHASALAAARRGVLDWLEDRRRRATRPLPPEAWAYEDFDLPSGGRSREAVRVVTPDVDLWSIRADDPDSTVPGRTWTTEVTIGSSKNARPLFSSRLIVSTSETQLEVEPAVPSFVLKVIDEPGLIRNGRPLSVAPTNIETEGDAEDLCDYLLEEERKMPVFIVTTPEENEPTTLIDSKRVAKATAGIARVFVVPAHFTWVLTNRLGRFRSVFGGAVRAYLPGFTETDDPYRHRLFLAARITPQEDANACERWLRSTAAEQSISNTRLGKDIVEFAKVKSTNRRIRNDELRRGQASDAELLETASELVNTLQKELDAKDTELQAYLEEVEAAEARAATSEQEYRALLYRFRSLNSATPQAMEKIDYPSDWSKFVDWLDGSYPDRVLLTPNARQMVRSPEYEDVAQVARAVEWLASEHYDRRTCGGGDVRDVMLESGIRNAPCGGDTYRTWWHGRRYDVNWHIKNGGNTRDPKRCLRIYYFWEPDEQQVIIDHLPSHRITGAS